jgi:hypothetical protein
MLLQNELVHKELKLDEGQAKKATELGSSSARLMSVINGEKKRDELAREVEKDLAFLKPEQRNRLAELTWQLLENIPAGPLVLAGDEAGSAPLKLTREQRDKLVEGGFNFRNPEPITKVLTAEQKKAFEALKGKPAAPELVQVRFGGGGPRGAEAAVPTVLQFLANRDVEAELKLTSKQKEAFKALAKKWLDRGYPSIAASKEQVMEARGLADEIEKEARSLLTEAQSQRLGEVMLQSEKARLRGERDVFTLPGVARGLKLSDAQKAKLASIVEERQKGLLPLFLEDKEARNVLESVKKHNGDTYKLLLAELTAEQKSALDGLFGKPFGPVVSVRDFLPVYREGLGRMRAPLHLFVAALRWVGSPRLHKELGLSEEQGKKLAEMALKAPMGLVDEKKLAEMAAEVEKELGGFLKPEQMKRLTEVLLQQYQRGSFPFSRLSLPRLVEVRKGLELTEEQLKKLGEAFPRVQMESVLTEAQKAKWKEMLGKASDVRIGSGPGMGGFPGSNLPPELELLQARGAAEDLKLSAEQKEKLASIIKEFQEATERGLGGGPGGVFKEFFQKLQAATRKAQAEVAKLLDAGQAKRMDELRLQQAKQAGLYVLLTRPRVAEGLKWTAEQLKRMNDLHEGRLSLMSALTRELISSGDGPEPGGLEEVSRAEVAIEQAMERKLEALLTREQKEMLPKLLGRPFKGALPRDRSNLGGGGGFGGGFGPPPG